MAQHHQPLTRGQRANLVTRAELPGPGPMKLKLALFVLDQFSGQKDHCWPSIRTLASCMNATVRTVQEAIRQLRQLGVLNYEDAAVGRASRVYRINYEALVQYQPADTTARATPAKSAGVQITTAGDAEPAPPPPQDPHHPPAGSAPEPTNRTTQGKLSENTDDDEGDWPLLATGHQGRSHVGAINRLLKIGVNARLVSELAERAQDQHRDGAAARVAQTIQMAGASGARSIPGFVVRAIEENWKPSRTMTSVRQ